MDSITINAFSFYLPLFFMFFIFLIGYYFAWTDFKPRKLTEKDFESYHQSTNSHAHPTVRRHEYSLRELGLEPIDAISSLPLKEQRRIQMDRMAREFSIESPETAAEIVKKWLSE